MHHTLILYSIRALKVSIGFETNKLHRNRIICLASARQMTGFFVYRWGCLSA